MTCEIFSSVFRDDHERVQGYLVNHGCIYLIQFIICIDAFLNLHRNCPVSILVGPVKCLFLCFITLHLTYQTILPMGKSMTFGLIVHIQ